METLAEPHIGFVMLPKRTVNVKTCELLRCARVTPDFVHTVSIGAARARLDLFQDDLYTFPVAILVSIPLFTISIAQVPAVYHGPAECQHAAVRFWSSRCRVAQDVAATGGNAGAGAAAVAGGM
jgi:hypothetical protein